MPKPPISSDLPKLLSFVRFGQTADTRWCTLGNPWRRYCQMCACSVIGELRITGKSRVSCKVRFFLCMLQTRSPTKGNSCVATVSLTLGRKCASPTSRSSTMQWVCRRHVFVLEWICISAAFQSSFSETCRLSYIWLISQKWSKYQCLRHHHDSKHLKETRPTDEPCAAG